MDSVLVKELIIIKIMMGMVLLQIGNLMIEGLLMKNLKLQVVDLDWLVMFSTPVHVHSMDISLILRKIVMITTLPQRLIRLGI